MGWSTKLLPPEECKQFFVGYILQAKVGGYQTISSLKCIFNWRRKDFLKNVWGTFEVAYIL